MTNWQAFATVDPIAGMTGDSPGVLRNLVGGGWADADRVRDDIVDPLNGEGFLAVPDTQDLAPFIDGLRSCPKSGLHNPLRNNDRYVHLGGVCARAAALLAEPDVEDYFTRLIQRVMPKSRKQCAAEVTVTRVFLENFAGDGVRFLARGFSNPGDHPGQESRGYRWPFGPVVVIAPFNFPLEIPALQALGALFMGNRPLVKVDSKVSAVFEQFLRLLIHCGLDAGDLDLVHCRGETMGRLIEDAADTIRLVQFTGSSGVAERVAATLHGKVRLEDAGFDWKIIGPDFDPDWLDYVAWQCDEDAYNAAGQKCSAQSALFVHENWAGPLLPKIAELSARRSLDDLTVGPVLTWTNAHIRAHIDAVLAIDGAELVCGGAELVGHEIPDCYGAYEPTAIRVPLEALQGEDFDIAATELFGPFQIVVTWGDGDLDTVLGLCERMQNHLTAAVVSADVLFQNRVLGATVNGTTYCGMRARTTGAPQNHWFGPSGDPRGAGIGTPEAIQVTWSAHREIIHDQGPRPEGWSIPPVQ
ncbi:MAG: aldehyde dehydrogenase family protein [Gammaproteobacteria bacterium]|nr:aldehyde dehydrogenase family protein [Gammaproteobacteria bacterium]MBT8104842.1 aldehyde dehydrogenase family protein [Gammaproteobacteria bacterium]NNF49996.1 aldehyde dehydrogenase family protein [Woeseiaceae bacterium]NNK24856.1 aldehyde dehydrogenase family protein [Woeseiaceae bacterium]NNL63123.1 aldehyde dehydrogenase family protein [Woeseiaceae bacterium]